MAGRLVIGCFDLPGDGGASTATYELHRKLLADGHDVHLVNFVAERQVSRLRQRFIHSPGNPDQLAAVSTVVVSNLWSEPSPDLTATLLEMKPEVFLGIGFIGARILAAALPRVPLIYLTVGCSQAKKYLELGVVHDSLALTQLFTRRRQLPLVDKQEAKVISHAQLIICHSPQTRQQIENFYPSALNKLHRQIVWFAVWITEIATQQSTARIEFEQRDIALLMVANSWERTEKNWPLVRKLVAMLQGHRIHIVGSVPEPLAGVIHEGFISDRTRLFKLMGNARTVASPSLLDSAPGVLFEASAMGSNIVTSKNSGNWQLCNNDLLVGDPTAEEFSSKIRLSLMRPYPDNMSDFRSGNGYHELVRTLARFQGQKKSD